MIRVAFQGELGAFGEEAVTRRFGEAAEPVPYPSFQAVGEAVASGTVDRGVLPIENSIAGAVPGAPDVLAAFDLRVEGGVIAPVHHCLLALPGASIGQITHVHSHPMALAQCRRFLEAHPDMRAVEAYDTAGAAREVAVAKDPTAAALASRRAAELYGLNILAENVEDRADNATHFVVIARVRR